MTKTILCRLFSISQSLLVETMKNWRKVHMPLTMVFAVLVLLHLSSLVFFWRVR